VDSTRLYLTPESPAFKKARLGRLNHGASYVSVSSSLRPFLCCSVVAMVELRAPLRADALADGENRVEIVMVDQSGDLAIALGLNYSEFPNSWL
jgi:hypothetical protein